METNDSAPDAEESQSDVNDEDEGPVMPSEKRCKLDNIDAPSTSSLTPSNDENSKAETAATENDVNMRNRFKRRNYRKRSNSNDSTDSSDKSTASERPNDMENNAEQPPEDARSTASDSSFATLGSIFRNSDSSSLSSDSSSSTDSDNDALDQSDSDSDLTQEIETKSNETLNKPAPKHNLSLVPNIIYRQGGIFCNQQSRVYDNRSNGLINQLNGSLYSVERMSLSHKLESHDGCVNCLNFSRSGKLLASGSDDLHLKVWNWARKSMVFDAASGHQSNVFQVKFLEGGRYEQRIDMHLISSARDAQIRHTTITPSGDSKSRCIFKHARAVHKLAIPDQCPNIVLTAGEDAHVVRVDLRDKKPQSLLTLRISGSKVPLYSVAAHPYNSEFCICGQDKYVRVFDERNTKECARQYCPDDILKKKTSSVNITCAVYNYLGTEILASYSDENVYLFDNNNCTPGTYLHSYQGHRNSSTIKGVNFFGLHSEFIMSGSDCGNLFIWDKNTEAIVQWKHGDDGGVVNCLEGHPKFPIIATSGLDSDIKIWYPNKPDGKPDITDLKKCIQKNIRRSEDINFSDLNFSLEYFMRNFSNRRNIARRHNDDNVEDSMHFSDDSDDNNDDDNDDEIFRGYRGPPCTTS